MVCRTVIRRPREDAADPVFLNSIRGTPTRLLPDDEPREPREPREQPLRIDVRLLHADLPPPISTEPSKPRRVYTRNLVDLPRYGYTPGCIGCEAAMIHGASRDHTEQSRKRIIKARSSDVALSVRVRDAHERMSRPVSDAEPNMKKVRFAEHTTEHVPPAVATSHTSSTPVTHGGSSSSSAPPQSIPIHLHVRPDDSDEHTGSKKLKLSDPDDWPSYTPMSSDVNLSSDDRRDECLLERFGRERLATK